MAVAVTVAVAIRYGPLFESFHRRAWWYGIWSMFRSILIGLILANVLDPVCIYVDALHKMLGH